MRNQRLNRTMLFVIPGIIVIWTLYLNFHMGPFYLRGIDPEYIYLINGINCANLDFNKIGHIDHPGTTLQLITGLFFRIIHLFIGNGDLTSDIISRPELYLSLSNLIMTAITFFLVFRLGALVYKYTSSMFGAVVLQASGFYTGLNIGILSRYTPDRLMTVIIILYFILYIKYLNDRKFSILRFSVLSGLVMGAGVVTKFNFLPLLLLPLFIIPVWRYRGYYFLSLSGSAILFLLPISSKYKSLWRMIKEMVTHQGLYGSGEQGIIDTSSFFHNFMQIFRSHPSFTIVTLLGLLWMVILLLRPRLRNRNKNDFLFLTAYIITIVLGLAMTAKHFKGYYALPVISLTPMAFYTLVRLMEDKGNFSFKKLFLTGLFVILLIFPILSSVRNFSGPNDSLQDKKITEEFIRNHTSREDYFIIEPIWMSTPMIENGLVLGVSYLHHERLFYLTFERIYPHILTWEGNENPLKLMRMKVFNFKEALLSGQNIFVYSKPGWHASELCQFVESYALDSEIHVRRDTVYRYEKIEEYLIRYQNTDGWYRRLNEVCGFEKQMQGQMFTDSELVGLSGKFEVQEGVAAHGNSSLRLNQDLNQSPRYILKGIKAGDVVASSVKCNFPEEDNTDNLLITCIYMDADSTTVITGSGPIQSQIDKEWHMKHLFHQIQSQPVDGTVTCYVEYRGMRSVHIDDFVLQLFSKNIHGN